MPSEPPDFGEPDDDWTDDYTWTRYRGPQPWPVPADWVLKDAGLWQRFPGIGEGLQSHHDVHDALDKDLDAIEEARGVESYLLDELLEFDQRRGIEIHEWKLVIAGETIFRREDPDFEDVLAATAEALSRCSNDQGLDDVVPSSGRPPEDVREEREIERRKEANEWLDAFAGGESSDE